jgi:hypothetical protein
MSHLSRIVTSRASWIVGFGIARAATVVTEGAQQLPEPVGGQS